MCHILTGLRVSYSHRDDQMCPILTELGATYTNVSYSHKDDQMCPIFTYFCRRVSYLGRSCPVELLRLGKRILTSIVHLDHMSFVSYSTSYEFNMCPIDKKRRSCPETLLLPAGVSCLE